VWLCEVNIGPIISSSFSVCAFLTAVNTSESPHYGRTGGIEVIKRLSIDMSVPRPPHSYRLLRTGSKSRWTPGGTVTREIVLSRAGCSAQDLTRGTLFCAPWLRSVPF
jgi:hypothetical protein